MNIDELLQKRGLSPLEQGNTAETEELMQRINSLNTKEEADPAQAQLEEELSSSDWNMGVARAVSSNMALGWGDEAGIFLAALGAKALGDGGESVADIYKDMKSLYDTEQQAFEAKAPIASGVASVVGAIASPASWLGVPKKAGLLYTASRAGGEGAIYGAGVADEGDRLGGAGEGGAFGFVGAGLLGATFKAGGFGLDVITSRKVQQDLLAADGSFTPLTLAAKGDSTVEESIQSIYKDIISVIPGGKRVLREQAREVMSPLETASKVNLARIDSLNKDIKIETDTVVSAFEESIKTLNSKIKNVNTPRDKAITMAQDLPAKSQAAAKATQAVGTMRTHAYGNFRLQGFLNAFPVAGNGATAARIEKSIKEGNTYAAMKLMDKEWTKNGFDQFFGKMKLGSSVEPEAISKMIQSKWDTDEGLQALFAVDPALRGQVKQMVDGVVATATPGGEISGAALGTIYSRIGSRANAAEGLLKRGLYSAQEAITDILEKNLSPADFKSFQKEKRKWKTLKVLRDAVGTAASDTTKRGDFTPDDWSKAIKRNNVRDARWGEGPLNDRARAVSDTVKSSEKKLVSRVKEDYIETGRRLESVARAESGKLTKQVASLKDEIKNIKKGQLTSDKAAKLGKKMQELQEVEAANAQLTSTLEKHKELLGVANPTWYHTLAGMSLLGGLFTSYGTALGAAGVLTAGSVAAKTAAKPNVQRAIAGQLPSQQAVQRGLGAMQQAGAGDAAARAATRGMLTGAQ